MSKIVHFKPRSELNAEANLQAFIAHCRDKLTIFGEALCFEDNSWNVTSSISRKARYTALSAPFSSWETAKERKFTAMPEPFLSFAKAYFRYQHGMRPVKTITGRLAALRALCAALSEQGTTCPTAVDAGVFNRAAQLVAGHFSMGTAYRMGGQLELLAKFMDDSRLSSVPVQWRNSLKRPKDTAGRVGVEFEEVRNSKLPSAFALDALTRAFRLAVEPQDLVITSIAALLCSAPDRVNEILRLPASCEVRQERKGLPPAFGLRFWPSKGAEPMVKWVIPSMTSVVEEALDRIRRQTNDAREVARWYETNPKALFLPAHLEQLRGREELTMPEVMEILFGENRDGGKEWCKYYEVPTRKLGDELVARFGDIESVVLGKLPLNFPVLDVSTGLKYSEALCVTRRNFFHATRGTYQCLIDGVDHTVVGTGLGNRSKHGFKSVFERLELFGPDDSIISIRSHQFRHYLNTLAHAGGMSELDIAKWSGRADIRQNSAYNHVSDRDIQARLSELKGENNESFGQLVAQTRVSLLPRARFAELKIQSAHTTDFGFCVHDFAMTPCQLHLDCTNCNEQVCIKGDELGEANARAKCRETKALLDEAMAADADGAYGASRWVEHQQLTLERLTQLVAIFDNPTVPRGAVIRLAHIKPASRLQQAAEARKALRHDEPDVPKLAWRVENERPST